MNACHGKLASDFLASTEEITRVYFTFSHHSEAVVATDRLSNKGKFLCVPRLQKVVAFGSSLRKMLWHQDYSSTITSTIASQPEIGQMIEASSWVGCNIELRELGLGCLGLRELGLGCLGLAADLHCAAPKARWSIPRQCLCNVLTGTGRRVTVPISFMGFRGCFKASMVGLINLGTGLLARLTAQALGAGRSLGDTNMAPHLHCAVPSFKLGPKFHLARNRFK